MFENIENFAKEHPLTTVGIGIGTVVLIFWLFSGNSNAAPAAAADNGTTAAAALAAQQYQADASVKQASIAAGVQTSSIAAQQAISIAQINASTDQNASNNATAQAINQANQNAAVAATGNATLASEFANLAQVLNNYAAGQTASYQLAEKGAQATLMNYTNNAAALAAANVAGQVQNNANLFGAQSSSNAAIASAAGSAASAAATAYGVAAAAQANAQASEVGAIENTQQVALRNFYWVQQTNNQSGIPNLPTTGSPAQFANQANNAIAALGIGGGAGTGTAAYTPDLSSITNGSGYTQIGANAQQVGSQLNFNVGDLTNALNSSNQAIASSLQLQAIPGLVTNLASVLGNGVRFDANYGG